MTKYKLVILMEKILRLFRKNWIGSVGGLIVLLLIITAIFAPLLTPYSPTEMNVIDRNSPPNRDYIFGTDRFGRDQFTRIVYGARVSLQVGMISVGIGVLTGLFLGLLAGYYKGMLDTIIMRFMDLLLSFPAILLALVVITVLGPDLTNTMIAIGITYIPVFTRIARGSVLSVREDEFVLAGRAIGLSDWRLISRHIMPNILAPIIVQASLALAGAILTEAALSFLGLGIQPPAPSWGAMLNESRRYMELAPWTVIFPSLAIMITVISFNLFGDGLRDILDPKIQNSR